MKSKKIERPLILAICGKSCTGKTSLANWLVKYFSTMGIPTRRIVGATTRPPREKESEKDYYFMSEEFFERNQQYGQFLETTEFRGWHYGTLKREIKSEYINIGIFNPQGLKNLIKYKYEYMIIPIYLEENFKVRMRRSYEREHGWKSEYVRRALVDFWDFKGIKNIINKFNGEYIDLSDETGVWRQSDIIAEKLKQWKVLIAIDKENKRMRLGNFA